MLPLHHHDKGYKVSKGYRIKQKINGWIRLIFSDNTSRNLFLFLLLNISFAFVELFYGIWTNSLGLISDSFHMFFDCTALVTGLVASVITKWRPNERFSYGYKRAEVLAGFVNGLFLLFIAFFIFSEAVERTFEPPEVKHDRLFLVSVLGFIVNLVGIFAFQHGGQMHGHSHSHGHSHGNSHGNSHGHSHTPAYEPMYNNHSENHVIINPLLGDHGHSHNNHSYDHDHSHSHETEEAPKSQIMQGVFLHILADTLGSVGVIISAILMSQFGWMIADPICSMFIALLVLISVLPLLRDSVHVLMQRTPKEIEKLLPPVYQRIMQMEEVYNVHEPHFWTLCSGEYIGNLKVEVSQKADAKSITSHIQSMFKQIGVKQIYVQIDYTSV